VQVQTAYDFHGASSSSVIDTACLTRLCRGGPSTCHLCVVRPQYDAFHTKIIVGPYVRVHSREREWGPLRGLGPAVLQRHRVLWSPSYLVGGSWSIFFCLAAPGAVKQPQLKSVASARHRKRVLWEHGESRVTTKSGRLPPWPTAAPGFSRQKVASGHAPLMPAAASTSSLTSWAFTSKDSRGGALAVRRHAKKGAGPAPTRGLISPENGPRKPLPEGIFRWTPVIIRCADRPARAGSRWGVR